MRGRKPSILNPSCLFCDSTQRHALFTFHLLPFNISVPASISTKKHISRKTTPIWQDHRDGKSCFAVVLNFEEAFHSKRDETKDVTKSSSILLFFFFVPFLFLFYNPQKKQIQALWFEEGSLFYAFSPLFLPKERREEKKKQKKKPKI